MSKKYHIQFNPKAQRELDSLSDNLFSKIDKQINALSNNPRPFGVQKLDKELHRIRAGNFRVIYAILDKENKVIILHIARRNEKTYKNIQE